MEKARHYFSAWHDVAMKPQSSTWMLLVHFFFHKSSELFMASNAIVISVWVCACACMWIAATKLPANNFFVYFYLCGAHTLGTRSSKHTQAGRKSLFFCNLFWFLIRVCRNGSPSRCCSHLTALPLCLSRSLVVCCSQENMRTALIL